MRFGEEPVFLGACPVIRPEGIYINGQRVIATDPGLVGVVGVGAVERRNPLPPGRYWFDLFEPDSARWLAWRAQNGVAIETTEHFGPHGGFPARDFIIFRTTAPVTWEGPGFPNVAGDAVKSASDTAQRPDPIKDPTDTVTDFLFGKKSVAGTAASVVAIAAGGALIFYIIARSTDHRARSYA